jgi:cell division protein FtsB
MTPTTCYRCRELEYQVQNLRRELSHLEQAVAALERRLWLLDADLDRVKAQARRVS